MARGRFVSRSISRDRVINVELERAAGLAGPLVWTWLIPHLDCEGRITGEPELLKAQVFPRLSGVTPELIRSALDTLAEHGRIVVYQDNDGDRVIQCVNFAKNQPGLRKDRESASEFPDPELLRSNSGVTPDQLQGKVKVKVKVKEKEKGDGQSPDASPPPAGVSRTRDKNETPSWSPGDAVRSPGDAVKAAQALTRDRAGDILPAKARGHVTRLLTEHGEIPWAALAEVISEYPDERPTSAQLFSRAGFKLRDLAQARAGPRQTKRPPLTLTTRRRSPVNELREFAQAEGLELPDLEVREPLHEAWSHDADRVREWIRIQQQNIMTLTYTEIESAADAIIAVGASHGRARI